MGLSASYFRTISVHSGTNPRRVTRTLLPAAQALTSSASAMRVRREPLEICFLRQLTPHILPVQNFAVCLSCCFICQNIS
jgi:hypothetical protein